MAFFVDRLIFERISSASILDSSRLPELISTYESYLGDYSTTGALVLDEF
jgi:hypothetical protein